MINDLGLLRTGIDAPMLTWNARVYTKAKNSVKVILWMRLERKPSVEAGLSYFPVKK
jgi:hypothetical protein